jgi:Bacterial type II/III secretion system short domain
MFARILAATLATWCFFIPNLAQAQQTDRSGLERRLGELEKQLGLLLKEVQELRKELKTATPAPAVPSGTEFKIFTLKNAEAVAMTGILEALFQGADGRALRITADPRTNSVLVHGRTDALLAIEAVIARLDETPRREKTPEPVKKSARPDKRRAELERRITEAEYAVVESQERAAWSQRLAKLGYMTETQARADAARLLNAEAALEVAKSELQALLDGSQEPNKKLPKE